jgi:mannose/fructose/N-acetylgalactosamine-specific phosphotransferase system component IIC
VTWAALIGLGGFVALDATSFGQLMLSRPLVSGTLAGVLIGMPFEGALLGALIEALSLGILPVGASKYPETGTAAVAAVGTLGLSGAVPLPGTLLLVLMYGIVWERIFGMTVIIGRYVNERLVHAGAADSLSARLDRVVERRHLASMGVDIVRGALVTAAALIIGVPLLRAAVPLWALPPVTSGFAVAAAAVAVLAGAARLFAAPARGMYLLLAGILCGTALLVLL